MALTQSLEQMRDALRRFCNVQGTTALIRHPNADLNGYLARGLSRLHFRLTQAAPDQLYLSTTAISTSEGVTVYALPTNFKHLISVDLVINGAKHWLESFEMNERPILTSGDQFYTGIPFCYRIRGGNYELLPTPSGVFTGTLWYVPTTTELASDASTLDTLNRLDDFVIAYAAQFVATKDGNATLMAMAQQVMGELEQEIEVIGRSRDLNSPSRIIDVYASDRWGRRRRYR